jgi:hypothetical protein
LPEPTSATSPGVVEPDVGGRPVVDHLGVLLVGLALACLGLGSWVSGRLGGRALLGFAILYVAGLALGALLYIAV